MWPADPSGRKWTSDRFREALKRESRIGLGQALTIAAYREIAIGISRRFLRGSTAFRTEEGDDNEEWNEENTAAFVADEQAGHTAHVAGMIYARGIMEQAGAVADRRRQFRMSSTDWHRFLGFQADVQDDEECKKRKRAPFESEADEARMDRWGRLRKMDTAAQLQRMMGKAAEFRGVQKEAIEAIVAGKSHIVIDKCHIVLNRRYDFRKEMQKLGKLASAETQMVMLTATLPPSEEDELFRRMYVERDQVDLFRAETARTNVAYRVIRVGKAAKKKEVEEIVLGMVQQKLRKHKTGKVVVYGNLVPKVKELAKKLDCHAYYHKAVGKASMLEEFAAGKKRPFTVLDYAQESGRAGRDGLRSEAVMIVQEGEQRAAEDKQAEVEQQLVRAYVEGINETATCRRVVLDRYLDRREKERVVCEEGEEKCDVCRGADGEEEDEEESEEDEGGSSNEEDTDTVEAEREEARRVFEQQQQARRGPRQTLIQQRQQEFADVEWLRRQLAWWTKRCGICEVAGEGQSGHDVRRCWRPESVQAKEMIKAVEEKMRFE
ncbi:unnamed protein product, partial [Alternaria alternata]